MLAAASPVGGDRSAFLQIKRAWVMDMSPAISKMIFDLEIREFCLVASHPTFVLGHVRLDELVPAEGIFARNRGSREVLSVNGSLFGIYLVFSSPPLT